MTSLRSILVTISAELRTDKVQTRNKAAEQLDKLLKDSKANLIELFCSQVSSNEFSGTELFNSVIQAIFAHSEKVQESRDTKSSQLLRNKNFVYRGIVTSLVDYHLEDGNHFLSKSCLFAAFTECFRTPCALVDFGTLFLDLLERGIFKTPTFVEELKVNEYSRILSYLFEVNIGNDDVLRFAILSTIIKTIDLAIKHVQIGNDLIDYLPEIQTFAQRANMEQRRADVIKLFSLFVSQLAVDYHYTICNAVQDQIAIIITYYQYPMKTDVKETFFEALCLALNVLYPNISYEGCELVFVQKTDSWPKTLNNLHAIVEKEVKTYKTTPLTQRKQLSEHCFFKMAAFVTYLKQWSTEDDIEKRQSPESRAKIKKQADALETILGLVQSDSSQQLDTIWLAIFTEVVCSYKKTVNEKNICEILKTSIQLMQASMNSQNLYFFRRFLVVLLEIEENLISKNYISLSYCAGDWTELVRILKSNSTVNLDAICEQQTLLQALIRYRKLTTDDCFALLETFISNAALKRNECVKTVNQILIFAGTLGFDKNSEIVKRLINWFYDSNEKVRMQSMLHGFAPIDESLVAETSAIAVINFLNSSQLEKSNVAFEQKSTQHNYASLLAYKENKKIICLDKRSNYDEQEATIDYGKTCLFQTNYNLLMRTINFEPITDANLRDVLTNLSFLNKIVLVMKALIEFGIFDSNNFEQCPLIKRMGFFLNQLEFQLKDTRHRDYNDIIEILQRFESLFKVFMSNSLLVRYLETQSLKELISYVEATLKLSASRNNDCELDNWFNVTYSSLKLLSRLCGSSHHFLAAFGHIEAYKIAFPSDVDIFFDMVEILCQHKVISIEIGEWFVQHLKTIFKRYHAKIDIIKRILNIFPGIFIYIGDFENLLQSMFVAVASLLKIAYKKSYPVQLTASIIQTVEYIAESCQGFHSKPEFTNICLMVVKFLSFSSLTIQFATVKAITAFIVVVNTNSTEMKKQFEFCDQIFTHLNLENLPTTTTDLEKNTISVSVQILISFFVFSKYHKEEALKCLANLCAQHNIKEANLNAFQQIARYYDCSLSVLCKPFIKALIHTWTEKHYLINEFPFYLCSANHEEFITSNLPEIFSCLLLYGKPNDFKPINKYISKNHLKLVLPNVSAYVFPFECKCPEAEGNDYKQRVKNLKYNANALNLKLTAAADGETIYCMMGQMKADSHFESVLGYCETVNTTSWYGLSLESVKLCLNYYINKSKIKEIGVLEPMINKTPLALLCAVRELQKDCMNCVFSWEKIKLFHIYTSLMDIFFDSISPSAKTSTLQSKDHSAFFVRDTIFFLLNFSYKARHLDVKKCGLFYLNNVFYKPQVIQEHKKLVESYLNEICKCLVNIAEQSKSLEIEKMSTHTIQYLIVQNKDQFKSGILLLDEFPSKECYDELRESSNSMRDHCNKTEEASTPLKIYIGSHIPGIEAVKALRQYVQKHKEMLQKDDLVLGDLVNKLIKTVRSTNNWELKNECAKCLGDIGSLKMKRAAYYFHSENLIYENESEPNDPNRNFHISLMNVVDKILMNFDPNTYQAVLDVAEKLSNSEFGAALVDESSGYFHIFSSGKKSENYLDTIASSSSIDWIQILKSTVNFVDYNSWVCDFMAKVYKSFHWHAFDELSLKNECFADSSLLPFIKLIISYNEVHLKGILEMLDHFFEEFVKGIRDCTETPVIKSIFKDKRIIRKYLDICECIRTSNNWSLPINLLNVTEACNFCQAYFMSIMYLELHYMHEKSENKKNTKSIMENPIFQNVAIKAYESIGCNDALSSFLNPLKSRIHFLSLKNNLSDILLETTSFESANNFYTSVLKRNGILAFGGLDKKSEMVDYEACWRLCQWDVPVNGFTKPNSLDDMEQEFQKHHYTSLKCLYNREQNNTLAALSNARHCVVSILEEISIECLQSVYKYLTWLQLLRQVEDFCEVQFYSGADLVEIFGKWKADINLDYGNFRHKEDILSHQITLFHTAGVRTNRKISEIYKLNPIETCLLNCIQVCKKAGEINLAKKNIARLRSMEPISDNLIKMNMLLEDAEISFTTGNPEITKSILDFLLHSTAMRRLYIVKALILFGEYLMETNSQTFEQVLRNTFTLASSFLDEFCQKKTQILSEHPGFLNSEKFDEFVRENRKNAYGAAAKYADREYIQFNTYIKSEEFQMKNKIIQQNRQAAESLSKQNKDRDKSVGATLLKKNANLDEREMQSFESKRIQSLSIAMEYYIKFCNIDESASESTIYRIIALWFSNKQDEILYKQIDETLLTIPTYKFLCALNQITGRLNSTSRAFLALLKTLLIKCVQDHPHQTLYKLFPLVYAFFDGSGSKTNDRVEVAKEIILKGKTKGNANCIKQLETIFPALIEFANVEITPGSKMKSMQLSEKLKKLKNLDAIQCPTINLSPSADLKYNITSVVNWDHTVGLVGGINAPKKLMCLCSDGLSRPQLLKGKDDLRQDAVMQQVFAIINNLLTNEPETLKRRLAIRTYNVVPLSMRSGILEWCENTTPLGLYLIAAHARYYPKNYTVAKCRNLSMTHLKSDAKKRLEMFNSICANIQPVMHFFLLEKFTVPGVWFERRLAYINSVATNSIVGFILGLGDRHTQNILIDERTAELIHIDFGIAFEQGKIMPTPETVPFRLTRDIVAPMGICKAGGIFKITCEATMEILRRHRSIIITILEVLLYDPLYMWKVLQDKASTSTMSSTFEETNLTAQRTLLCVQNKLEGKQAGILGTSDVSVQVQRLINEAMSPYNLCQLYPGWDPYL